jgi:N-acetylneuraminic acid mutarotase
MSQNEIKAPRREPLTAFVAITLFVPLIAGIFNSCDSFGSRKSQDVTVAQATPNPTPTPTPTPTPLPTPTPNPTPGSLVNQWLTLNSVTPPAPRFRHSAVWTGTRMIIWGGADAAGARADGASLDPLTGVWTTISTTGAPTARYGHSAIWNGTRMVIWGGTNGTTFFNDGAAYDPVANTWTTLANATVGVPARAGHTSIFNGSTMLTWGGSSTSQPAGYSDGGYYYFSNPPGWLTLTGADNILRRIGHSAVWTGSRMILFGGQNANVTSRDGFIFDPSTYVFTQLLVTQFTPTPRQLHSAAWSGLYMVVWGGSLSGITTSYLNDGSYFNPVSGSWTAMTTTGAPSARHGHTAIWAGDAMIVWGGFDGTSYLSSGAVYR